MNSQNKLKFYSLKKNNYSKKKYLFTLILLSNNKYTKHNLGFTLIELLVVVIIIGILSAVALPNLVAQVGKARETEAKSQLGVLARTQQSYRFQYGTFFNGNLANLAEINLAGEYYSYTADPTANKTKALHTAYSIDPENSYTRDFAIGTYYLNGGFSQIFCVANGVDNDGTTSSVTAPNTSGGSCTGGYSFK